MAKTIFKGKQDRAKSTDLAVVDRGASVGRNGEPDAGPADLPPTVASEEEIRLLAYRKWEEAGSPMGDGLGFWLAAEREVKAKASEPSSAQK